MRLIDTDDLVRKLEEANASIEYCLSIIAEAPVIENNVEPLNAYDDELDEESYQEKRDKFISSETRNKIISFVELKREWHGTALEMIEEAELFNILLPLPRRLNLFLEDINNRMLFAKIDRISIDTIHQKDSCRTIFHIRQMR